MQSTKWMGELTGTESPTTRALARTIGHTQASLDGYPILAQGVTAVHMRMEIQERTCVDNSLRVSALVATEEN